MTLEDIGEDNNDALLCITKLTSCCQPSSTSGNWFFPDGTRVSGMKNNQQDFHRTRGQMVLRLIHKSGRGGVDGIYHCVIPDSRNVTQTIYIGVYTATTGE